jgi:hypothetical protein
MFGQAPRNRGRMRTSHASARALSARLLLRALCVVGKEGLQGQLDKIGSVVSRTRNHE